MSPNSAAAQATEQIVQMIAGSIAALPKKKRLAAMQAFERTMKALNSRGKKTVQPQNAPASRPPRKRGKKR